MVILNRELTAEQKRSENLEVEANKVFEAEEQMMILNEELSVLRRKHEVSESQLETERKRAADLSETSKTSDFQAEFLTLLGLEQCK